MEPFLLGYIDPGSGALLVQALIASAFGGLIVFRDVISGLWSRILPLKKSQDAETLVSRDAAEPEPIPPS